MSKRRQRDREATKAWSRIPTLATYAVATLPMVPALMVNIDLAQGRGRTMLVAAVAMVVFAAVAAEGIRLAPLWWQRGICALVALVLTAVNILNAAANATGHSDDKSDHRRAMIAASKDRENEVAASRKRRAALAAVAGEVPPAAIEAEIASAKATNADRWRSTAECSAEKVTAEQSKAFCAEIAKLASRLAAATEREKIDARLAALSAKTEAAAPPPQSADSYAENAALLLSAFGVEITETRKKVITASKDWLWALGLELLAAFGPMIVVIVVTMAGRHMPAPRAPQERAAPAAAEPPPRPVPSPTDDPVYAFIATAFERKRGVYMKADEPWQLWLQHCAERGLSAGSQRAFGMAMKACHQWERNHNRPRYVNVQARKSVVGGGLSAVA